MPHTAPALRVAHSTADLTTLADPQVVLLFLLSVAVRPMADDFPDPAVETFAVFRRDLFLLSKAAGLAIPSRRFYAALDAVVSHEHASPAVRFVSHASVLRVAFTRPYATASSEESWRALLAAFRLRGLGVVLDTDLDRTGLDVEAPLPTERIVPTITHTAAHARRCEACDEVLTATRFGTERGRLRARCLTCR